MPLKDGAQEQSSDWPAIREGNQDNGFHLPLSMVSLMLWTLFNAPTPTIRLLVHHVADHNPALTHREWLTFLSWVAAILDFFPACVGGWGLGVFWTLII